MAKEKPSKAAKECLSRLLQQEIVEIGKVAKTLCQRSGSREVSIHRKSFNSNLGVWESVFRVTSTDSLASSHKDA